MTTTATSPSRRVTWIDAAKGLAIILVVVLHATESVSMTSTGAASGQVAVWDEINYALGSMRMPLFFAMSGLLAAKWVNARWGRVLGVKVALFVWLLVLWPFVRAAGYLLGAVVSGSPDPVGEALDSLDLPEAVVTALPNPLATVAATVLLSPVWPFGIRWFIWALAVFFVVARAAHRVPPRIQLAVAAVVSLLATIGVLDPPNRGWDGVLSYAFFFFAGVYLKPQILRLGDALTFRTGAAVVAVWAACVGVFLVWPNHALLVAMPVTGVVAGIAIGRGLAGIGALRYVGTRTLVVYLTHMLVIHAALLVLAPVVERLGPAFVTVDILALSALAVVVSLAVGSLAARSPLAWLYAVPGPWARFVERRYPATQAIAAAPAVSPAGGTSPAPPEAPR
jgi:fucose 4-O-acetylase-like acetyltransferase